MKIVFYYHGRYQVRDAVTVESLSALALRKGHTTGLVYDQDMFGVTDNVLSLPWLSRFFDPAGRSVERLIEAKADIVVFLEGFSRSSKNREMAREIKKRDRHLRTVIVSMLDRTEFRQHYDHVLIGEPEFIFDRYLERTGNTAEETVFLKKEGVADLDALPPPDKDLFAPCVNFQDSYMIYTTKGCPFHCSYCEETVYKKASSCEGYFRSRKIENVLKELEAAIARFHSREVIFKDSVFTWNKQRLKDFLALYGRRIGIPFKCFGKSGNFDYETAVLLKEHGCYCVEFGAQTFNEELKRTILKRDEKNESLEKAFSACDAAGLRYDIDHMFGLPQESIDDHKRALAVYRRCGSLNRVKCHNLVYYREAEVFEHAPDDIKKNERYSADFFSSVAGEGGMRTANRAFQLFFKVAPLLPLPLCRFLMKKDRWRIFLFLPSPFVIVLQAIIAIKNKDRRFAVYARYYPLKLRQAIAGVKS